MYEKPDARRQSNQQQTLKKAAQRKRPQSRKGALVYPPAIDLA
jgi:hypothetical protein